MGNKNKQLPFSSTTTHEYKIAPDTQEFLDFKNFQPTNQGVNAGIEQSFARAGQQIEEGTDSPYSGITSAAARGEMKNEALSNLATQKGAALNNAWTDYENRLLQHKALVAGMKTPQLVQTGSSGYNSQGSTGGGAQVASAGISGGLAVVGALV